MTWEHAPPNGRIYSRLYCQHLEVPRERFQLAAVVPVISYSVLLEEINRHVFAGWLMDEDCSI